MKRFGDGIPNKVLKEIFPTKQSRTLAPEEIYLHLKHMILSGKLEKGQRLWRGELVHIFNVNEGTLCKAFARLKKRGLIIVKPGEGSFVA